MKKLKTSVQNFILGDESAFNDIYSATYRKILLTASTYMKNPSDTEDAVQDIYIQAYKKINTIQDYNKVMPWFMTLTRNVCINMINKRSRTEITVGSEDEGSANVFENIHEERVYHSPEKNLQKKEKSRIIIELVSMLPIEQKDSVLLHYIEKRSVSEVAMITNTTTGTVKSRLNYARKKLQELVKEREIKDGIKLRLNGLFIFTPFILRYIYGIAAMSTEVAATTLTAIEAILGITIKATAVSSTTAAAVATTGGAVATVMTSKLLITTAASLVITTGVSAGVWVAISEPDLPEEKIPVVIHREKEADEITVIIEQEKDEKPRVIISDIAKDDVVITNDDLDEPDENTPEPILRPIQTPTPTPRPSPAPTSTPAVVQTPTPAPVHTPNPTPAHTPDPTPAPTPVHTPEPTPAPTPTPVPTPAPTPAKPEYIYILVGYIDFSINTGDGNAMFYEMVEMAIALTPEGYNYLGTGRENDFANNRFEVIGRYRLIR